MKMKTVVVVVVLVLVLVVVRVVVVATLYDAFCFLTGILREPVGEHPPQSFSKNVLRN